MLQELKQEKTVSVLQHLEESHVETISTNWDSEKETETDSIRKVEQAFQNLELKRIGDKRVNPTTLTKNWYPRLTPPDI